jgi:hypothetical protein
MTAQPDRSSSIRHMVKYLMPGSFFSEDTSRELPERNVEKAVALAPKAAFAFTLYDLPAVDFDYDDERFKVVAKATNESAKHYIGGQVYTADELRALAVEEGDPDKYRIESW